MFGPYSEECIELCCVLGSKRNVRKLAVFKNDQYLFHFSNDLSYIAAYVKCNNTLETNRPLFKPVVPKQGVGAHEGASRWLQLISIKIKQQKIKTKTDIAFLISIKIKQQKIKTKTDITFLISIKIKQQNIVFQLVSSTTIILIKETRIPTVL